jgi:tRNA (adenine57-N1/adenine58-N1)-methyltransferase catalytic subunit
MTNWNNDNSEAREGDLVELVGVGYKHIIIQLEKDGVLHSHRGVVQHNDLIGKPWGTKTSSHTGNPFFLLQPSLADLIRGIPRSTQIMYPKDIGFILLTLGVGPGTKVLEAGTGSGGLTTALAYSVGNEGHVLSYDKREEQQKTAIKNIEKFGLAKRVTFKIRDIADGFDEVGVDALFLDVPNPYDYLVQVKNALKPGGFFGTILPTTNQVIRLLPELRRNLFSFIEVVETSIRYYKPEPERFRPVDRMVAHTGYLIFARPFLTPLDDSMESEAGDPQENSGNNQ